MTDKEIIAYGEDYYRDLVTAVCDIGEKHKTFVKMSVEALKARKTGKWIHKPNVYGVVFCSECDFELHIDDTKYCPNCGVRMEGVDE